ncbi:transcription factor bHLH112-like [Musa acuminata AAA Group]|uniref:transcription factor bHLH112-like n=1 Tax=Musa acuminata AAA Group TaxID=214697 RepID=UPI0031D07E3B
MAEDLETGICSGGSWWNPEGSGSFDAPTSMSCSTAMADMIGGRAFCLSAASGDDTAGSAGGSSIAFRESNHMFQHSDIRPLLIDSAIPSFGLVSSSMNWTRALSYGGRPESSSLHAMLQEDLGSRPYIRQDTPAVSNQTRTGAESWTANPSSDMNQNLLVEQHHFSSGHESSDAGVGSYQFMYGNRLMNGYQSPTTSYQGSSNELWQPSWAKFSHQFLKSSHPKQQSNNQLQFTNNTLFWNASAATSVGEIRSALCSPATSQFDLQPRTIYRNLTAKMNPEGIHDSCSSSTMKTGSEPAATKKLRTETPSPQPTFKVRKEKLGDRITALQQIVSPFGKTDTASVLQEAIEYIKFLQDQVGVLSSPYLKMSDKSKDCSEPNQDLRSRGLCLVPVASTHPVASETTADFWHPTFGGIFR